MTRSTCSLLNLPIMPSNLSFLFFKFKTCIFSDWSHFSEVGIFVIGGAGGGGGIRKQSRRCFSGKQDLLFLEVY